MLMKHHETRTPGTKRVVVLNSITSSGQSKRTEDMERNLLRVEELMHKHEALACDPLDDDLGVTVIVGLCAKHLRERLELVTKDMRHTGVREGIMT